MARKKDASAPKRKRKEQAPTSQPGRVPPPWEQGDSVPAPQMQAAAPEPITLTKGKKLLTKIADWMELQRRLEQEYAPLVEQEMALRKEIASTVFTGPTEGVNYCDLPDGWKLKFTYHLDRKFEQPAMAPVFAQLPAGTADFLINWQPYLNVTNFRKMQPEAVRILEQCLVTKPGTPKLELVPPAA